MCYEAEACSNPARTTGSHLKRIVSTKCCIHTVLPPDDGPIYARNMNRLTKYTKQTSSLTQAGHMGNVMVWYVRVYVAVTNMNHKRIPTLH